MQATSHVSSMDMRDAPVPALQGDFHSSGVSWGAVLGGAVVAAALSLILLALGAGFGLSVISPWSNNSGNAAGAAAVIWLIVTEIVASAMGGYLAGRLRTRWHSIHTDEVHFRDTANGFLVWAVAVVLTGSFLATAAVSMISGSVGEAAVMPANAIVSDDGLSADSNAYFVDRLFRSNRPGSVDPGAQAEAARIFVNAVRQNDIPAGDLSYLGEIVSSRTGLTQSDADRRVAETVADAKQMVESAQRTASHTLLWTFVALLIGAFCASYAATWGGKQRDRVQAAA